MKRPTRKIYVPKNETARISFLNYQRVLEKCRVPNEADSFKIGVPVVWLITKGKGERETFSQYIFTTADFGKVSAKRGEVAVKLNKGYRPMRFNIESGYIQIFEENRKE